MRARRLRAQLGAALGQPADRHLERRVGAQRVTVVGVRIPRGDHQRPKANHLGQPVAHSFGRPPILDAARQPLGQVEPLLDLCQQQHPGVRSQSAAVGPHDVIPLREAARAAAQEYAAYRAGADAASLAPQARTQSY